MSKRITVISKNNCQACIATKRYLDQESIDYIEVNVENEANKAKAPQLIDTLREHGFQAFPVVVIDTDWDTAFSGFRPDQLKLL